MAWGAIAGFAANVASTAYNNNRAKRAAERDRGFQERMSNTAHQRQVKDLEKAGLNKMLSANSGASASGGSQANLAQLDVGSSAMEALRTKEQIANMEADTDVKRAQEQLTNAAARKTGREADILGPKSSIMDDLYKAYKGIVDPAKKAHSNAKSGPKRGTKHRQKFDLQNQKPIQMKRKK